MPLQTPPGGVTLITITMPEEVEEPKPKKRPGDKKNRHSPWWKRLLDKLFHRYEEENDE
jgi:hypothetical protein